MIMWVHSVFPKPLDTVPSVFLDGILGISSLYLVPVILKRLQEKERFFMSLDWGGLQSWSRHVLIQCRAEDKLLFYLKYLLSCRDVYGHCKRRQTIFYSVLRHKFSETLGKTSRFRNRKHLFRENLYLFQSFSMSQEYSFPRTKPYL